ncbi:MAG TPA: alpha/beta hydrolase [Mycobacteriales bacterium]|nr:alpha/beta hydrolase [Mycobacteriales bacterium]
MALTPIRPHSPVAGGRDLPVPGVDVRLAATRWAGTGPPVVLLHGLASTRRFWNLVVPGLAGLPVVAWDQRGHGESDAPAQGYDMATVVADVATAMDSLGLSRAVVVGHSWGAAVALAFAAAHPERTLAVVAVDGGVSTPSTRWSREDARIALAPPQLAVAPEDLVALISQGHLAAWWSADVENAVLPIFGVGPDGTARARLDLEHHLEIVDALWDYDPATTMSAITVPTWLVIAQPLTVPDDPAGREWRDDKQAGIALATETLAQPRVVILAGAVHDVPLQWPAAIAGLIRSAVDEVRETARE